MRQTHLSKLAPSAVTPSELTDLILPHPLRNYQWQGVKFLVNSQSALLADEMGLGKTVQAAVAIRLLLKRRDCNRVLIVTPASLRLNWERELSVWAPEVTVRLLQGAAADRQAFFQLPLPVLIASYEQIREDAAVLPTGVFFDLLVLDETQRIKNAGSATALACRLVPHARAWGLTGTPIENAVSDLVAIYGFLKRGLLHQGMRRHEIHGAMQPYFLRRTKEEVLPDLPPIIEQDLPLELLGEQRKSYDDLWEARKERAIVNGVPVSEMHLLALITELKKVCNFEPITGESSKMEALKLLVDGLAESDDKMIVFSQYVETLEWISPRLGHVPNELFFGGLNEAERDRVVQTFEEQPGPRVLLMSIRAGGVGLNLQAASTVVLFDRWWNPAVEDQAIQRAHRFGRNRPLHVVRFLVTDSIEERIQAVLDEKDEIFEEYVEQAENATSFALSRNELRRLLDLTERDVEEDTK